LPVPDNVAIPVNLADSVKRNPPVLAAIIQDLKHPALARWERDLSQGDPVNSAFAAVEVVDLELPAPELRVVAYAREQFVDRLHG
jgi:hypothetical protein